GVASVLVATPFILIQWNLKRLLAYSSIEHVGIMAVGFGLGGETAVFGALLHMTYHTFAKPVAFFSAGTLAQLHRASDFDGIGGGTLGRTPVASGLLLLATLMLTGSPPFGLFFSEMTILKAGFSGPHVAIGSLFLAALVVLFCGFFYQVGRLVLGEGPGLVLGEGPGLVLAGDPGPVRGGDPGSVLPERLDLALGTTLVAAVLAIVSAFYLPGPLVALIRAAVRVVEAGA
ncbi:MAG TPA: proton-conducting transporter membrane subunit, partial [Vicinamibacteria bacterium]|nr:proton-conducting transporter membrane subunit [Vicinamibacteria bacterium]